MTHAEIRRFSGLAALAATGIFMMASPAAAEVVLLDCEVSFRSNTHYFGEQGSGSGESGTWRFRLDTEGSRATLMTVGTLFDLPSEGPFNLQRVPVPLTVSEDAYTFCIELHGSCNQRRTLVGGSWYNLDQVRIDRRRGTFRVVAEIYDDLLQGRAVHEYSGTCQRAPEQQF